MRVTHPFNPALGTTVANEICRYDYMKKENPKHVQTLM